MSEEVLSTAERIRKRREARDAQAANGRQPRVLESESELMVESIPQETVINQKPVVVDLDTATPVDVPPPTTSRRRTPAPPVPKPAEEPTQPRRPVITENELQKEPEVEPVLLPTEKPEPPTRMERVVDQAKSASQALILGLLEHMRAGEQLLITRDGQNVWSIVLPTSVVGSYEIKTTPSGKPAVKRTVAVKRLPKNFDESLLNPAYLAFLSKWRIMTNEQKIAHANTLGVPLPTDEDPMIFNMRLSLAVQAHEGIDKWKPEYATSAARAAAEDKARKGMPY